ncbi:GGDEF domain-containing protein [Desulfovibrio inopinatus]|uniref:GGDEF domain-containing protein n=1 Tax=Desulfovibrio inopinatus TaxID=102109 RepID=UPI0004242D71|nr:bifunctional diguanylate cyclase/phosphodiesterase [Desulfovibrio inopinatus]
MTRHALELLKNIIGLRTAGIKPRNEETHFCPHTPQNPERNHFRPHIQVGREVGVILLMVEGFASMASLYGTEIADTIDEEAEKNLAEIVKAHLGRASLAMGERIEPGAYLVNFTDTAHANNHLDRISDIAYAMGLSLRAGLRSVIIDLVGQNPAIRVGFSSIPPKSDPARFHHLFYEAYCDARRMAQEGFDPSKLQLLREFQAILNTPRIKSVYQPIVDLKHGNIFAWEALSRGPADGHFVSPLMLFNFAEDVGSVFRLERVCRESAFRQFGQHDPGQRLFVNIHPRTLTDPGFSPGQTKELLEKYRMRPQDVVFEITERHSTKDFNLFHRTLEHYRNEGYQVAVDDVGAGYSGLWSIAEIRPDFIKVDMSLIRGIDSNPVKRALLETFLAFSDKIGCKIITEGIETESELSCLIQMGAHYGQGYFLQRPDSPKPNLSPEVISRIALGQRKISSFPVRSQSIRELVDHNQFVSTKTTVGKVKEIFEEDESIISLAVLDKVTPVGLLMSHHMDRVLSTRYGVSLYSMREVTRIMDTSPLIVDAALPVEDVAKAAMARDSYKIYDHVVVVEDGAFLGLASVQRMLDSLAHLQVEMAKGANPLSGLPGNITIEREIERRATSGMPSSFIYIDLDNFKAYNDIYGFKEGDAILLLMAKILVWAAKRHGEESAFVGHVGGDDFVLICKPENAERICKAVTRCFKRIAPGYYTEDDRKRGYIVSKDRTGNTREFDLVSASMAIVDCHGACSLDHIAHRSAEMKKYAKSKPGNVYVRDRRSPIGCCVDSNTLQDAREIITPLVDVSKKRELI